MFSHVQNEAEKGQITFISDCTCSPDSSRINHALRKWQTSQKWVSFGKTRRACHYCPSHLLFPPSVYRETHLCPTAAASGTAFWVVFEHTSVSSVQKQFRFQEYLWAPFDMVAWYTQAHTLFVCSLSSTLKTEVNWLCIYIYIYICMD